MYGEEEKWGVGVMLIGVGIRFARMVVRCVKEDDGQDIEKEDMREEDDKGVKG